MMIEVLYPEYANLYGDPGNIRYLQQCLPEAEFVYTPMHGEPTFVSQNVDMLYMGPMTESAQEKAIARLRPYAHRLQELMEQDTVMLMTGNAMEVLGEAIENEDGSRIEGLGLLPLVAKRDMMHRYDAAFKGQFESMSIVGFKSQFTMAYPTGEITPFVQTEKGVGLNHQMTGEGVRFHNVFGTYLLGPLLVMNPLFTRYLLQVMGADVDTLPFEEEAMEAYRRRLADFE